MRRPGDRRGVLLLIVLVLLALFALVGVTFIVVAGHYQRGAAIASRRERTGSDPSKLTDAALYQLLRDAPAGSSSALSGHSLLRDLYGRESLPGRVTGYHVDESSGGQFVRIDFQASQPTRSRHFYNGAVLTMLSGAVRGISTRVVEYSPGDNSSDAFAVVEAFRAPAGRSQGTLRPGDRLLINGQPFNGTGIGYDLATGTLRQTLDGTPVASGGYPVALLPNLAAYSAEYASRGMPSVETGGANESWDAVDYQNMFLGMVPVDASGANPQPIIPSLHRPALARYWRKKDPRRWSDAEFRRRVILRPLAEFHPGFGGGNPGFDPESGPWDVDNDGDGLRDSIWVDLGFPVHSTQDGRLCKPLAAILCVDLDGRLNVNAHGNLAQLSAAFNRPLNPRGVIPQLTSSSQIVRGQGHGPAEINLGSLFTDLETYRRFLTTRYRAPHSVAAVPGGSENDFISSIKNLGFPSDYSRQWGTNLARRGSLYASPPDVFGRRAVLLDLAGQPFAPVQRTGFSDEDINEPYEINLVEPNGTDHLYSFAELERLLRAHDQDANQLPNRLAGFFLTGASPAEPSLTRLLTTASFDVCTPNVVPTRPMRAWPNPADPQRPLLPPSSHISQLRAAKLIRGGVREVELQRQLSLLLPFELRHGQRMNLNRLTGNGRDDGGIPGVSDDLLERYQQQVHGGETLPEWDSDVQAAYDHDDPILDDTQAAQLYARHLYCLMLLLMDEGFVVPTDPPAMPRHSTGRIAQWAANAVDFRDPDAIMTYFEYDMNPFDGWDVDGRLETNEGVQRGVVWGCEYPHLILTETLAFHDLRVKDLANEAVAGKEEKAEKRHEPDSPEHQDDDLDQYRMPQGSAFFELYCTGNPHRGQARGTRNETLPRELYSLDSDGRWKLDLARVVPTAAGGGPSSPVWRLAISARHAEIEDSVMHRLLRTPDALSLQPELDGVGIERIVLFTSDPLSVSQAPALVGGGGIFYNKAGMKALLAPKQYALVGPRPTTVIGSLDDDSNSGNRIQLDAGPEQNSVLVELATGATYPMAGVQMKNALGIIAVTDMDHGQTGWDAKDFGKTFPNAATGLFPGASGVGVNISAPLPNDRDYYPQPKDQAAERSIQDAYSPPLDHPLDGEEGRVLKEDGLLALGTRLHYRTVFLQRLADPTRTFDAVSNPYVTVDWMPIDLTVFNGEDRQPEDWPEDKEWIVSEPQAIDRIVKFSSRERGLNHENIWRAFSVDPQPTTEPSDKAVEQQHFRHTLAHSLGFLNRQLFGAGLTGVAGYEGDPRAPFPWLTWNDRPYESAYEVLLVPSISPQRLLFEFSFPGSGAPQQGSPYDAANPLSFRTPSGHLLNFLHSSNVDHLAANFSRLLDYVEVPSRYVGTEKWYDPQFFQARPGFRPPFNRLSRFRDPGRVNINTIHDSRIWDLICGGTVPWSKLQESRGPIDDAALPTYYPNPFRSAASSDMMPLPELVKTSAEATLLRPDPEKPSQPLFGQESLSQFNDTQKNPYFRYQILQRLGSMVTNHSNVFAAWITIGYFEVEPNPGGVDAAHPDGYRLGAELGSESGQINRHRAFYIIDRSIPVAFEPGMNHNVDQAIVLRRFLE